MRPQSHPDLPFDAGHPPTFDGESFVKDKDEARLTGQCMAIFALMRDERWRTLHEIASAVRAPEASVSAQLRHLRKPRFGAHQVDKRRTAPESGLYEYRVIVNRRLPLAGAR